MEQILHDSKQLKAKTLCKPAFARWWFVFVFALMLLHTYGQQIPVYSGYFFNKYLLNPAFTGIDNEYRGFGFYRTQWGSIPGHPVTGGATAEASFWKDQIGVGAYVVNDKIGVFNRTNAALSYAQKIVFAKDHQVSVGVQGGIFTNRVDFSSITTADLSDPGLLEQKPIKTVFDMSIGAGYKWKDLLVGFSVPNVLQPLASYATPGSATNYEYVRHYTAFAQYKIELLHGNFNITPQLFMRKGPATGYQFDATAMLDYKNIVFVGGGYRNAFGVIGIVGVNVFNMFTIAYAYDYTTQPAITGQVGSTHEITAGFHLASHYKTKKQNALRVEIGRDTLDNLYKKNDTLTAKADSAQLALDSALARQKAMQQANDSLRNRNDEYQRITDSLAKKVDELLSLGNTGGKNNTTNSNNGNLAENDKAALKAKDKSALNARKKHGSKAGQGADDGVSAGVSSGNSAATAAVQHRTKEQYKHLEDSLGKQVDQVLNLKQLKPEQSLKGNTYRLDKIYFETGKNTLQPKSRQQLNELAAFMARFTGVHILIVGYTDNTGNDAANDQLSMSRANAVAEYLIAHGVELSRLEFQGLGSSNPVGENTSEDGRRLNRRVEFTIVQE